MSREPAWLAGPPAPPARCGTVTDALAAAARSGTGLTFVDAQEQERFFGFAELRERALRVAVALAELGVRPGDVVSLVLPTGVEFMDAFFGVLAAGAVPAPLYPPVRLGRLEEYHARTARMLVQARARALLTDARVGKLLGVAAARARPPLGVHRVADLLARGRGALEVPRGPQDLGLVQFSSGTTVEPKPVGLTHANLLANAAAIDTFLPDAAGASQCGASWLPLYHDMGLIGGLLVAVLHPGPLTLLPPEVFLARPALWLRAISRHRATISPAPNFAYGLCLKRIKDEELAGCDLSSWRLALNGAEPVSPEVTQRFAARFARFGFDGGALLPVYGLSEATLAVTFSQPGLGARPLRLDATALAARGEAVDDAQGTRALVSLGVPLPGMEVRVVGPQGATLEEGAVGSVLVKGPSVMKGYLDDEAATARAVVDGWLDTGDLGFVLRRELYLCGRAKDVVIVRGRNHAPQEFEEALVGMPGLRAGCAAAVGWVPPGGDGEELLLFAELEQGTVPSDALAEAVRAQVVARTGVRAHAVELLAPGTLPRTSSGKCRRGEALRQYQAGELLPPPRATALGLLKEVARSSVAMAGLKLRAALAPDADGEP